MNTQKALELAAKITSPNAGPWDNLAAADELRRLASVEAELAAIKALEPVARLYVGSYPGEELSDWELRPRNARCDALNELYVNNPTTLNLYAIPKEPKP